MYISVAQAKAITLMVLAMGEVMVEEMLQAWCPGVDDPSWYVVLKRSVNILVPR